MLDFRHYGFLGMLCIALAGESTVMAAELAYEPFDYRARTALPGCDGGVGFHGPWQMVSARDVREPDGTSARDYENYIGGGRCGGVGAGDWTVAGLRSRGGHYRSWVWLDTEASNAMQWRRLAARYEPGTHGNAELWLSFVVSLQGSGAFDVNLHDISPETPNPYITGARDVEKRTTVFRLRAVVGKGCGWSWLWRDSSGDTGDLGVVSEGVRNWLVARFVARPEGGTSLSLWMNPPPGLLAPATGDLTVSSAERSTRWPLVFNALGLAHDKSALADFDEFRLGHTWADVAPAPPGGTLFVSGGGQLLANAAPLPLRQNGTHFDSVEVGAAGVMRAFSLRNEGGAPLTRLTASLQGDVADFSITGSPSASLAPTEPGTATTAETEVTVTFRPVSAGAKMASLTICSEDPTRPQFSIPLAGFATLPGTELTLTQPVNYRVFQRDAENLATVPVAGTCTGGLTRLQWRARLHPGAAGRSTDWADLMPGVQGGPFATVVRLPAGGWYVLEIRAIRGDTIVVQTQVDRVGSGEVFICSGQSNAANSGAYPQGAPDDRVASLDWTLPHNAHDGVTNVVVTDGGSGYTQVPEVSIKPSGPEQAPATATAEIKGGSVTAITLTRAGQGYQASPEVSISGGGGAGAKATAYVMPSADASRWTPSLRWRVADTPIGPADGNRGCLWPVLGGRLTARLGVPVGFINVAKGGMPLEAWSAGDGRQLLWPLLHALRYVGSGGARAVLWHQGESSGHVRRSGEYYSALNTLIQRTRHSEWPVEWVVAQASILNDPIVRNLVVTDDQARLAADLVHVHPGPNTDELQNNTGPDMAHRHNPGVRWDNIHFNPSGMSLHAALWEDKIQAAFALPSILPDPVPVK